MSLFLKSMFYCVPIEIWRRIGRWTPDPRWLSGWAAIAFARLKQLAPYALIEILLPGGSVVALTLWFYRRRKKGSALRIGPVGAIARRIKSGEVAI